MQPTAPAVEQPQETAPSNPPSAETPPADLLQGVVVVQEEGRTRYEIPNPDARPTEAPAAPEGDTKQGDADNAKSDGQTEATPPEGEAAQGDPGDLSDEALEELVRNNKKLQARIEQLAGNRLGNRLQSEREKMRSEIIREQQAEAERMQKADEAYQFLHAEGRDRFMERFGVTEEQAVRWEADYLQERRRGPETPAPVDRDQIVTDIAEATLSEFRKGMESLPFYGELPEETQKVFADLVFDKGRNWFEEGLSALAKGLKARDDRIAREHKAALEEARKAGANSAQAEREDAAPVVVNGSPSEFNSFKDAEVAYSEGRIDRNRFHQERTRWEVPY